MKYKEKVFFYNMNNIKLSSQLTFEQIQTTRLIFPICCIKIRVTVLPDYSIAISGRMKALNVVCIIFVKPSTLNVGPLELRLLKIKKLKFGTFVFR